MLDRNTRLPSIFGDFNDSFVDNDTFISSSLPSFGFDTNLPFDSIFPLSSGESFSNIGRSTAITNGFTSSAGVVHNIPIKIEGGCGSNNPACSIEPYILSDEYKNNNLQNTTFTRSNNLSATTPPLPHRKQLNNYQTEPQTYAVFNALSGDEDRKIRASSSTRTSTTAKTISRPPIAPKPKLSYPVSRNKDSSELEYSTTGNNNVTKVAWRHTKLAAPLGTHSDAPSRSRQDSKNYEQRSKEQDSTSNLIKELEALYTDDIGSSSPSSSGIVADASDSITDYQQSNNNLSERDSAYDYPRARLEFPGIFGKAMQPRTSQLSEKLPTFTPCLDDGTSAENAYSITNKSQPQNGQGSTSVLQNVFDELGRKRNVGNIDTNTFSSYNTTKSLMRRLTNSLSSNGFNRDQNTNFKEKFSLKPLIGDKRNDLRPNNDVANARKQAVCLKLEESSRLLEYTINSIRESTSPPGWRQPHVLQKNLLNIKELVGTTVETLKEFLDAAGRIALDPAHLENEGLQRMLNPLRNSYSLLSQLKQNIEHTGWTLAALARPKNNVGITVGNDALDQFVAVVRQVPSDCLKMYKWASMLIPSNEVRFIAPYSKDHLTGSYDSFDSSLSQNFDMLKRLPDFDNSSDDSKRCSLMSTVTTSSSSDVQPTIVHNRPSYSNMINNHVGHDVNLFDNSFLGHDSGNADDNNLHSSLNNGESRVFEEDDLESVLSDRESLSQDYALVGDGIYNSARKRPLTNGPPSLQLSSEMTNTLSEDDRQLLRFYAPQLESHIDFLSGSIEEFLSIVEEQLPPHEFVQKSKLIILTAHKLIYIGDNIAQCISAPFLTAMAKKIADRLCRVLKNCVQATKNAANKYPDVSAVKAMVDSVVTVSHAAFDLKLLVEQCS